MIDSLCEKNVATKKQIIETVHSRKAAKKSCSIESIIKAMSDFHVSQEEVERPLQELLNENVLTDSVYNGKKVLKINPSKVSNFDKVNENCLEQDYIDFKKFVTDSLAEINDKISYVRNDTVHKCQSCDAKDIVINFLRDELTNLRTEKENLLKNLHVPINPTQCCVTSKNSLHDVTNFNLLHESFAEATAVEKSDNRLMSETIKFNVEQQLNDVRKQLKSRYENSIDTARNNGTKSLSNVENNDDLNYSKKTSLDRNKEKRKNVIICGDSILNGIDSTGLSTKDHKTVVRNFPGATSKDMCTYIKPLVEKKPNKMIIHVGTNDLTNNVETISNLRSIHEYIKSNSKETEVVFSKLCIRDDKRHIIAKVDRLNAEIETFCSREKIKSIDHRNINKDSLSRKKLHLNRKGLTHLAMNFKNHVAQN